MSPTGLIAKLYRVPDMRIPDMRGRDKYSAAPIRTIILTRGLVDLTCLNTSGKWFIKTVNVNNNYN